MKVKTHNKNPQPQDTNNLYRMVFENANDGIIIHDTNGKIYDINSTMYRRLGYSKEEMLAMNLNDLVASGFDEKIIDRTVDLKQQGVAIFESADRRKDGTIMPVEVSARYFEHNGTKMIQSIVRDIQERKTAETLIQTSLNEREILGEETKHSVRFNQAICGQLLERLPFLSEPGVHSPNMENQIRRIKAVNFIQEKIYAYSSVTRIEFKEIATQLIQHLFTLYRINPKKVRIQNRILTLQLDLHKTALCAYIMIELLSNALRHAFPDSRSGEISITSALKETGGRKLCVRDNGVGFPEAFDIHTAKSFGLSLVNEQVKELEGKLSHSGKRKTEVCIHF